MAQFGYRQSTTPTASGNASTPTASGGVQQVPASGGSSSTPPSPVGGAASSPVPSQRCCDTGRPLFTDPLTGQPVCSCQYEMLGYGRPALPALSVYSAAAYPEGVAAYFPGLGAAAEQSPFYGPAAGLELKENLTGATPWPYPSVYHPYDTAFAGYPFNGYGMDLNGARRKNATRETTSTLKAWLNEHKKNPYPTKGEKIMLAIITKMTLTQVSTWFANARRRLKKENKMTWEPRNRVEDDDNNNDDDDQDRKSTDGKDKDSGTASSSEESEQNKMPVSLQNRLENESPIPSTTTTRSSPSPPRVPQKPRIWSLADMANKNGSNSEETRDSSLYTPDRLPCTISRIPIHSAPYTRPPDFYRALYNPAELLESYQKRLGPGASVVPQSTSRASPSSPSSLSSSSEPNSSTIQPLALGKV